MHQLLSCEDYIDAATHIKNASDAKNVLEFILCLLRDFKSWEANHWALGRLMLKIVTNMPVIPESLFISGVIVKEEFVGLGGYGTVIKGELQGAAVALKLLTKVHHGHIVSCPWVSQ